MARKLTVVGGVVVLALLGCGNTAQGSTSAQDGDTNLSTGTWGQGGGSSVSSSSLASSSSSSDTIPFGASPVWGSASAKLTIVEFGDYQSPYGAEMTQIVDSLRSLYPTQIRWVYKHFPMSLHTNARPAAAASMAAQRQGKFWDFNSALAPHYFELSLDVYSQVATDLGLDLVTFRAKMGLDADNIARMDEEYALGLKFGVTDAPTFFANGVQMSQLSIGAVKTLLGN